MLLCVVRVKNAAEDFFVVLIQTTWVAVFYSL